MTTYTTTHYETLRVSDTATDEEVRVAYRQLVKVVHPDAGGAVDEFRALQEAWDVLKEPASRRRYDDDLRWASAAAGTSPARRHGDSGAAERTQPNRKQDQRLRGATYDAHEQQRVHERADLDRRAEERRAERECQAEKTRRAEHLLTTEPEREAATAGINRFAATNTESPKELLLSLASDPSPLVCAAVAANSATPDPVIRVLTSDVDPSVATAAAAERDRRSADQRSSSARSRWFRSPGMRK